MNIIFVIFRFGHPKILRFLISRDADINSRSYSLSTPLHEAVCNNQLESVEILLDSNCEVDIFDRDGETPLQLAIEMRNKEIISVLLKNGARLLRKNS